MRVIHGIYAPALRVALGHPRRTLLAALGVRCRAASASCRRSASACFPNADIPQFRITIETPTGASLADTDRAVRYVEAELARHEEVEALLRERRPRQSARVLQHFPRGNQAPTSARCSSSSTRTIPAHSRRCSHETAREVGALSGRAHPWSRAYRNGPPIVAPIEIAIEGPDLDAAAAARERGGGDHRRDTRHARRRQSRRAGCAPISTSHRHRQGGAARRGAGRGRSHGARSGGGSRRRQVPRGGRRRIRHHAAAADAAAGRQLEALDHIEVATRRRAVRAVAAAGVAAVLDGAEQHQAQRPAARGRRDRVHDVDRTNVAQVTQDVLQRVQQLAAAAGVFDPRGRRTRGAAGKLRRHRHGGARRRLRHPRRAGAGVRQLPLDADRRGRDTARHRGRLHCAAGDGLRPFVHRDHRSRRADRHRDQEFDPAGGLHEPAARAGRGARRGHRRGRARFASCRSC